jgi:hypothetical protein
MVSYADILRQLLPTLPGLPAESIAANSPEGVACLTLQSICRHDYPAFLGLLFDLRMAFDSQQPALPCEVMRNAAFYIARWNCFLDRLNAVGRQGFIDRAQFFHQFASAWVVFVACPGRLPAAIIRPPVRYPACRN